MGDRVAIDGLVVDDECAVRLVREREEHGDDPVRTVLDAVEIGARVLDREQAGANAEFVKAEFEKAAHDLNGQFADRARQFAEFFNDRIDKVLGPENGHLNRELEKLSPTAAPRRSRTGCASWSSQELTRSRDDLMKQFSAADGNNPLADFKAGTIRVLKAAEERQHETQQRLLHQMGELEKQLQALRAREGEARGGRGRARARQREGPHVRGGRRGGRRPDRARAGRRGRGSRRREGGHRQGRRRGRGHRRVQRAGPRPDRVRGEGPQEPVGTHRLQGARQRTERAERGLRRDDRALRRPSSGQASAAARIQRRQDARRAGSRRRLARPRIRLPARPRPRADEALGRRRDRRRAPSARPRSARWRRSRRSARSSSSSPAPRRTSTRPPSTSRGCPAAFAGCCRRSMRSSARPADAGPPPDDQLEL